MLGDRELHVRGLHGQDGEFHTLVSLRWPGDGEVCEVRGAHLPQAALKEPRHPHDGRRPARPLGGQGGPGGGLVQGAAATQGHHPLQGHGPKHRSSFQQFVSNHVGSGMDPREEFRTHRGEIEEALEVAERDFLPFSEKHLQKFEAGSD